MMKFPYGKAPLVILVMAVLAGTGHWATGLLRRRERADLTFLLFAKNHLDAYEPVVDAFERKHGVKISMQLVSAQALNSRLQAAMLTNTEVPDLVEIGGDSMTFFARGPLEDIGFVDITDRLHEEGLYNRIVESRFALWTTRGRIFCLPHDVHPVALAYRSDLVEKLGINVNELTTWDRFLEVGREVTEDLDGDGHPDRFMIDLPYAGYTALQLLLQRGGGIFDKDGRVIADSDLTVDTMIWHIKATRGDKRISFDAGWGSGLSRVMSDGLALFYICPDWRSKSFEMDVPHLAGKMKLMPLPAWEPGGRRTTTWGGTGLAITKACKKKELAWDLAKDLYFDKEELGERFANNYIIPPLKDAWELPEFDEPNPYYSGQAIGRLYAELAPQAPPDYITPYSRQAGIKMTEAYMNAADYYERKGEDGLREFLTKELKQNADYVRMLIKRNRFYANEQ